MSTDRREVILNAFIEIGRRKGLDNTTMKDIAKEVGISVGTIYLEHQRDGSVDAFGINWYLLSMEQLSGISWRGRIG